MYLHDDECSSVMWVSPQQNLNVSRPSEHPPQSEVKMSPRHRTVEPIPLDYYFPSGNKVSRCVLILSLKYPCMTINDIIQYTSSVHFTIYPSPYSCCCLKKKQNSHIQRIGCQPEKTTHLHGGQSRSWSAEQGKENKRKSLAAYPPPPHPPHCSFGENK